MFDLAVCQPPQTVSVLEAPAPSSAGGLVERMLFPLHVLRERIIATTGFGLDADDPDGGGADVTRHGLRDPGLGFEISYLAVGDREGRPVVFLHGTPGAAEEWGPFLRAVPPGHRYLAPDRPGFGQTTPGDAETRLARHAVALRALLEPYAGTAPVLVGYSYGAPVALRAAIDMPALVGGVLLVSGTFDPELEETHFIQWVADLAPVSALLPRDLANANDELLALQDELGELARDLPRIAVPVSVVHGLADTLAPPEHVAFLQHHLPAEVDFRVVIIEDADHFLPWSYPAAVTQALTCLLSVTAKGAPGPAIPAP